MFLERSGSYLIQKQSVFIVTVLTTSCPKRIQLYITGGEVLVINAKLTSSIMDLFSAFVNWFSELGKDLPETTSEDGGQDFFSRLMNKISG